MALDENKYDHLEELSGSDYEIADGQPDIQGWEVKDEQGAKIGEVDELLFDVQSRKVRYLVIDLDNNGLGLEEDKKVLIPIGVADLYGYDDVEEEEDDFADDTYEEDDNENSIYNAEIDGEVVIVPVTASQLKQLPAYEKGNVSPETELMVRSVFEGPDTSDIIVATPVYNKDDFYTHDHFDENKFYGRETQALPPTAIPPSEAPLTDEGISLEGENPDRFVSTANEDDSQYNTPILENPPVSYPEEDELDENLRRRSYPDTKSDL